jgi:flagellar protein FlaG
MFNISSTTGNTLPSATIQRPATPKVSNVLPVAVAEVTATQNSSVPAANSSTSKPALQISSEAVQRASEALQRRVATLAPELQISVDQSSGRSIIKFTDRATNKVIQQFPSEDALALTKALDRFQRGLLLNRLV